MNRIKYFQEGGKYTIQWGDTFWDIARALGITVDQLKAMQDAGFKMVAGKTLNIGEGNDASAIQEYYEKKKINKKKRWGGEEAYKGKKGKGSKKKEVVVEKAEEADPINEESEGKTVVIEVPEGETPFDPSMFADSLYLGKVPMPTFIGGLENKFKGMVKEPTAADWYWAYMSTPPSFRKTILAPQEVGDLAAVPDSTVQVADTINVPLPINSIGQMTDIINVPLPIDSVRQVTDTTGIQLPIDTTSIQMTPDTLRLLFKK